MALHLVVQKFNKATGAYLDEWIVQEDISLPAGSIPWETWSRGISWDPDGSLWVGSHRTATKWSTAGALLDTVNVPGDTPASPWTARRAGATATDLYLLVERNITYPAPILNYVSASGNRFQYFGLYRMDKTSHAQLASWIIPYTPVEAVFAYAEDLVVDPARAHNGVAVWCLYSHRYMDRSGNHWTRDYLDGIADHLPAGSKTFRIVLGQQLVTGGSPAANGTPIPRHNRFDWRGVQLIAQGISARAAITDRLQPNALDNYYPTVAASFTGCRAEAVHADSAGNIFLVSRDEQFYREYTGAGALVRQGEIYRHAASDGTASGCYVYDITTDATAVYVLLLADFTTTRMSSVYDALFGFEHHAVASGGNVNHYRALPGRPLSAAEAMGPGVDVALTVLPNGDLGALIKQSNGSRLRRISHDDGRTWENE